MSGEILSSLRYRKAKEYGCEGAFYAWESQETGDDACTDFNITDVFTKRPLRTYFREGQIHISADMAYALWEYCRITGDYDILVNGGLELAYQCVRFFYTYAYYKPVKKHYELLNVVGPDEYHERVNNNAFTNYLVKKSADFLIFALDLVEKKYPNFYDDFKKSHEFEWIYVFANELYIPKVNNDGVIEQFDGYFKLEDISIDELMKRVINPDEYWGGHGLASTTKVIKQADVVMLLNVLRSEFSYDIKKANWEYYEPYCQHASSLSACAYAIVAAEIGKIAASCGEDSDCTAGTLAAILGIINGNSSIAEKWLKPLNGLIETTCVDVNEKDIVIPKTIDELVNRVALQTPRFLDVNYVDIMSGEGYAIIADEKDLFYKLEKISCWYSRDNKKIYSNPFLTKHKFIPFNVYVDYNDAPYINEAQPKKLTITFENNYNYQQWLNVRVISPEEWEVAPVKNIAICLEQAHCNVPLSRISLEITPKDIKQSRYDVLLQITSNGRHIQGIIPLVFLVGGDYQIFEE